MVMGYKESEAKLVKVGDCPRDGGFLYRRNDSDGEYVHCLHCGYYKDLYDPISAGNLVENPSNEVPEAVGDEEGIPQDKSLEVLVLLESRDAPLAVLAIKTHLDLEGEETRDILSKLEQLRYVNVERKCGATYDVFDLPDKGSSLVSAYSSLMEEHPELDYGLVVDGELTTFGEYAIKNEILLDFIVEIYGAEFDTSGIIEEIMSAEH